MKCLNATMILAVIFMGFSNPRAINGVQGSAIGLDRFLKSQDDVVFKFDALALIVELKHQRRKSTIRFQLFKKFIIYAGKTIPVRRAAYYGKDGRVMLPSHLLTTIRRLWRLRKNAIAKPVKNTGLNIKTTYKRKKRFDFIVLDAGHGGKDPGAFGYRGVKEKQITLKTTMAVYKVLKRKFPRTKIYLTRAGDKFKSLEYRSNVANRNSKRGRFGVFLSLHCNATLSLKTRGYEIYYLSVNPSNEESRRVMLREQGDRADNRYVKILESILINEQIQSESKVLARQLNRAFLAHLRKHIRSRGVRRADFAVLRDSLTPAVLIEMGYITNKREAKLLQSSAYQKKFANSLADGLARFLRHRPGL